MNKIEGETGSQNIGILPGSVFARNCVVWPQGGQVTSQMPLSCYLTCQRWSWFRKYLKSCAETRLLGHAGTHNFLHSLLLSLAMWRALATEKWEEVIGSASQPGHEGQVSVTFFSSGGAVHWIVYLQISYVEVLIHYLQMWSYLEIGILQMSLVKLRWGHTGVG